MIASNMWIIDIVSTLFVVVLLGVKQCKGEPFWLNLTTKTTWQSSTYTDIDTQMPYPSSFAVDGCTDTDFLKNCCTHTNKDNQAWWSIDLGKIYTIVSVKLVNRKSSSYRLRKFHIYGSELSHTASDDLNKTTCAYRENSLESGQTMIFNCSIVVTARYVIIQKTDTEFLTLCEVDIKADCAYNTYKENEDCKVCSDYCKNIPCQPDTGNCKCKPGYTGDRCTEECLNGTYGYSCEKCSPNCAEQPCNKTTVNGACTNGCKPGYTGGNCSEECPNGTYGYSCEKCSPNCAEQLCKKTTVNGECTDGCNPGYTGGNCSEECPNGTYGYSCEKCSANCAEQPCNKTTVNGACTDGCKPGYTGGNCSEECPNGTYGYSCEKCSPNCAEQPCNKTTVNGACTDGCKPGYTGGNCSEECPNGTYGYSCEKCSPNCAEQLCNKITVNAACTDGCKPGYTGGNCSEECQAGKYGLNCHNMCSQHCFRPPCNKESTDGECVGGCKVGYMGQNCTEECNDGFYGLGCNFTCSPNCLNSSCQKDSDTGLCIGGCKDGYIGGDCQGLVSQLSSDDNDKRPNSAGPVVGGIIAVLLVSVIVVILVVLYLRKRRNQKSNNSTLGNAEYFVKNSDIDEKINQAGVNLKPVTAPKPGKSDTKTQKVTTATADPADIYVNVSTDKPVPEIPTRLGVREIGQYVRRMQENRAAVAEEYENIPKITSSWNYANRPDLKGKNRYKNIMPYDNNRVTLPVSAEDPLSDYINASFIKDYGRNESYIAALGTTKDTLVDTWTMIWEYGITYIFMVTNLIEGQKIKCEQYWPDQELASYGHITVQLLEHISEKHIEIRSFKAMKGEESRAITQYHYTAWPDKQVPSSFGSILRLRALLKEQRIKGQGPILVHCSAGIGRTGTLIALDILLDQLETEGAVDICQCVTELRHQRTQMVQSMIQYKLLYEILFQHATVGDTLLTTQQLKNSMASDWQSTARKQFQYLEMVKPFFTIEELEFGQLDNKVKNRDLEVVPAHDRRIKLHSQPELYINAVYVEGFQNQNGFCATQLPLEDTVGDFWKIVLQEKCAAIIYVENIARSTEWLPGKDYQLSCEGLSISTNSMSTENNMAIHDIHISMAGEAEYANITPQASDPTHDLKVYVLTNWANQEVFARDKALIRTVYEKIRTPTTLDKPVMVTCRNGSTDTGLIIAVSILLDMFNHTGTVDFVQVVKNIRKNRPQFITNQDQYDWLHVVVQEWC